MNMRRTLAFGEGCGRIGRTQILYRREIIKRTLLEVNMLRKASAVRAPRFYGKLIDKVKPPLRVMRPSLGRNKAVELIGERGHYGGASLRRRAEWGTVGLTVRWDWRGFPKWVAGARSTVPEAGAFLEVRKARRKWLIYCGAAVKCAARLRLRL